VRVAALDIDDTLANLRDPLMVALNQYTKKDIHWSEWNVYDLADIYEMTVCDFRSCLIESNVLRKVEPMADSIKFCQYLIDNNYFVLMVTARGWHPQAEELTKHWLKRFNIPYHDLYITKHNESKYKAIEKYGKIDLAIDHSIKNIIDYKKSGMVKHPVLFHHPWNKNYQYDKIIHNIMEAVDYVEY
jgi:uncharacterized HAD superfamily protein